MPRQSVLIQIDALLTQIVALQGALPPAKDDAAGRDLAGQFGTFKTPGLVHMRAGDVVEVEIDGIGVLSNTVIANTSAHDPAEPAGRDRRPSAEVQRPG